MNGTTGSKNLRQYSFNAWYNILWDTFVILIISVLSGTAGTKNHKTKFRYEDKVLWRTDYLLQSVHTEVSWKP